MSKAILLFVAALVACQAEPLQKSAQFVNLNTYWLYTRDNPRNPVRILPTELTTGTLNQFRTKTAVIVHGHEGSYTTSLNPTVKDAFLTREDINVIIVDWSFYAGQPFAGASIAVPSVGTALVEFIQLLVDNTHVTLNNLHLVGFNLGAHVVGSTGRSLGGQVARITGLDPSGSGWGANSLRLASSDARYVEVIHTDGGTGVSANGIGTAIGHVDFFPNGGKIQPGCFAVNRTAIGDVDFFLNGAIIQPGGLVDNACNHNRAWELFAASLTHNSLVGNQCTDQTQLAANLCRGHTLSMGNNDLNKIESVTFYGIYRVNTQDTYPYAL